MRTKRGATHGLGRNGVQEVERSNRSAPTTSRMNAALRTIRRAFRFSRYRPLYQLAGYGSDVAALQRVGVGQRRLRDLAAFLQEGDWIVGEAMRLRELVPCAPPFVDTGTRSDRRVERRETHETSPLDLIAPEHLPTRRVRNHLGASDGHYECARGDENENVPTHWQPPSVATERERSHAPSRSGQPMSSVTRMGPSTLRATRPCNCQSPLTVPCVVCTTVPSSRYSLISTVVASSLPAGSPASR